MLRAAVLLPFFAQHLLGREIQRFDIVRAAVGGTPVRDGISSHPATSPKGLLSGGLTLTRTGLSPASRR